MATQGVFDHAARIYLMLVRRGAAAVRGGARCLSPETCEWYRNKFVSFQPVSHPIASASTGSGSGSGSGGSLGRNLERLVCASTEVELRYIHTPANDGEGPS